MTLTQRHRFRRYIRALRQECKTPFPIKVRCRTISKREKNDCGGEVDGFLGTSKDRTFLWIVISDKIPYPTVIDTLIHEWAHAVVFPVISHGKMWGKAYAQCYSAVEKEIDLMDLEKKQGED